MKEYMPHLPIFIVCLIGLIWQLFNFSIVAFLVFGVIGFFTGKKVYNTYKQKKQ